MEPRKEQILAKVRDQLASIVGDGGVTYWYTPAAVVRSKSFHSGFLDRTKDVVYVMVPDFTTRAWATSSQGRDAVVEFDLWCLKRYADPSDPFQSGERDTIGNRLAADVERKLSSDPGRAAYQGLEVDGVEVIRDEDAAEVTNLEEWACVVVRVKVGYRYRANRP